MRNIDFIILAFSDFTARDIRIINSNIEIMRTEKKLFEVSYFEMIKLTIFVILLVNGVTCLFTLLIGASFISVFNSTWLILIGYPLAHGVIQTVINRNGVLIIDEFEDAEVLQKQIEYIAGRISYKITEKNNSDIKFRRKTWFGRIQDMLFREDFKMIISDSTAEIYGKRNTLLRIEKRLKYSY